MNQQTLHQLKNFGCFCPTKPTTASAEKEFAEIGFKIIRDELSFAEQVKILTRVPYHRMQLGRKKFKAVQERKVDDKDSIDAARDALSMYKSLIDTCGKERAAEIYTKIVDKAGFMLLADFFPTSNDFRSFDDPFDALSQYCLGFFQANEQASLMHINVVLLTHDEFHVDVTDCVWHAIAVECGHPELYGIVSRGDDLFLPTMGEPFATYSRSGTLCRGNSVCDFHYFRR